MPTAASAFVTAGFIILPLFVAAAFLLGCEWAGRRVGDSAAVRRRRALVTATAVAGWMLVSALVAASGVLRKLDSVPPPFALLVLVVTVASIAVPFSPLGRLLVRGVPLWALVGFQVYRLPLELVMHQAYEEGALPLQMTYSGRNFDILTGITAALLGLWLARGSVPRWVIAAWNLLGFALLVNIVTIAILSTPLFAFFGQDRVNMLVTYPPFVWLPTVLVAAAFIGHLLVWRWLAAHKATGAPIAHPAG